MEDVVRNKLRNVVTRCRKLLEESISQQLQGQFGVYAGKKDAVQIDEESRMTHLSDEDRQYRRDLIDHFEHIKARGSKDKDALAQLIREIAFTHLNRLCAYKMMEAREVYVGGQRFREAVSRGTNSNGFKFYLADHPEDERLFSTGKQDIAYRHFLDWLGGLLSEEIGVLFSPNDPANRLYPRQKTLDELIDLLNGTDIKPEETDLQKTWPTIWEQDETIGWVYQYFTPKELRDAARDPKRGGSQAPRNSYELAFRNQFFTPRYVVEFLTDNTLGRIWYEMCKGHTKLTEQCRYMVRRPNEVFLAQGQDPPESAEPQEGLSQEELLKQPVHICHRPKKDPRELRILDPACGSGHFLLYCFDLFVAIYLEAYGDPELGPALQKEYPTLAEFQKAVPGLILKHNLHGIEIDLRCTQIAAFALWLRCQRAYRDMEFKKTRPTITRSNIVCAEPMPGEQLMLREFVAQLEPRLLGQLVEVVFNKMKLAGEAGSLLQIEEEIRGAVAEARRQWLAGPVHVQQTFFGETQPVARQQRFDFSGISDAEFFEQTETRVVEALRDYAERSQNGHRLQRRLFTEDAVRGFAFVDMCHKRFDVVLMNPPYGDFTDITLPFAKQSYPGYSGNIYSAFWKRSVQMATGFVGALTSRTFLTLGQFSNTRDLLFGDTSCLQVVADLGAGVLDDAAVETCACTVSCTGFGVLPSIVFFSPPADSRIAFLESSVRLIHRGGDNENVNLRSRSVFTRLPGKRILYSAPSDILALFQHSTRFEPHIAVARPGLCSGDDFRFTSLWWELPQHPKSPDRWKSFAKGGEYERYYADLPFRIDWGENGKQIKDNAVEAVGSVSKWIFNERYYFRAGITFPNSSAIGFSARCLPEDSIISVKGQGVFPVNSNLREFCLGLLNSGLVHAILSLLNPGKDVQAGDIKILPFGAPRTEKLPQVRSLVTEVVNALIRLHRCDETSPLFVQPHLAKHGESAAGLPERVENYCESFKATTELIDQREDEIERLLCEIYGVSIDLVRRFVADVGGRPCAEEYCQHALCNIFERTAGGRVWLSYAVGCGFGRWDIRYTTGVHQTPDVPDPFARIALCTPGMLKTSEGSPLHETPEGYPVRIDGDGILVDDPDHHEDVIRRVREVMEVLWNAEADQVEQKMCSILGVKGLRDYFRKPVKGGFWNDHLKRYSKSHRRAPIYWLLQSSKKNYALWLYYQRLDKDMLFKALVNYVEPRIQREINRLGELRSQRAAAGDSAREAKRLDRDIERQEDLLSELRDFEERLRKIANLNLVPDLNDGVVLNIAPLHELVPWNEAKKYWDELLEGKYEWSSIGKQLREKGLVKEG